MSVLNVKGDMSQGHCCFTPILYWGRYIVPLTIQTMRLWRYEADIKQISLGSTTHNIFSAIFAGMALTLSLPNVTRGKFDKNPKFHFVKFLKTNSTT